MRFHALPALVSATALMALGQATAPQPAAGKLGAGLEAEIAREGRARVVILLAGHEQDGDFAARSLSAQRAQTRVLARLEPDDLVTSYRFRALHALAGELSAPGLARLANDPDVARIDLDVPGGGGLAESAPLIRATALHSRGVTGKGVSVAVLDTGVASTHPDLGDDLVAEQCFCTNGDGTGCCPGGGRERDGRGSAEDDHGHGSNVSGIVTAAGRVAASGIAPDAKLVAVKVLDSQNRFSSTAQVLAGLDWLLASRPDVRVVNMSLGTDAQFEGHCDRAASWVQAFSEAVGALRGRGTSVFACSMNRGAPREIAAPACVSSVVAVGATYDANFPSVVNSACTDAPAVADAITCFSNSGVALDLLAPGASISSAGLNGGRSTYRGTSQAAPHAAGAAALLLELQPSLTPDQVESALKETGVPIADSRNGLVFPRIDVAAAASRAASTGR